MMKHSLLLALLLEGPVLPVDLKQGELNKELGLPSDYTTTVEGFIHSLGLP